MKNKASLFERYDIHFACLAIIGAMTIASLIETLL